ncbi:hypothetical protein [Enterococcus avium]|uniref:hypothetical protein n=1 Tax=Enterococcus avium TaxID=33945 RepID=UPI0037BA60DA
MNKNKVISKIKFPKIFLLALFLIPYDSIPHIMPSIYRPITAYAYVILMVFMIFIQKKFFLNRNVLSVIVFFVFASIYGVLRYALKYGEISEPIKELIPVLIGFSICFGTYWILQIYVNKYNPENVYRALIEKIGIFFIFPIIIALLDMCVVYLGFPHVIKTVIQALFGGFQETRLTAFTYEASWLAKHMLFITPVYFYLIKATGKRLYKLLFLFSVIIFLATLSLKGIILLIIAISLFLLVKSYWDNSFLLFIKRLAMGIGLILLLLGIFSLLVNFLAPNTYMAYRLQNIQSFQQFVLSGGSNFIRIGSMEINLIQFFQSYFLGDGFGSGTKEFPLIIYKYFPQTIAFKEVSAYISSMNFPGGPLFTRIFSELGIIGVSLFYCSIISCLKKTKKLKSMKQSGIVLFWICSMLAMGVQDSYSSVYFWFSVGIMLSVTTITERINNDKKNPIYSSIS